MAGSISHFLTAVEKFSCCSRFQQTMSTYITNILVSLFVFLGGAGGGGEFVKSTRRRNDRLPRVLANKLLAFD